MAALLVAAKDLPDPWRTSFLVLAPIASGSWAMMYPRMLDWLGEILAERKVDRELARLQKMIAQERAALASVPRSDADQKRRERLIRRIEETIAEARIDSAHDAIARARATRA